tara:strand:+ start:895 stop:1206 length:312 start_codon:yes stop_codon:yes gene_type:complete
MENKISCNGCFLEHENKCYWFTQNRGDKYPKKIPSHVFDKGCNLHQSTVSYDDIKENSLVLKLIEVFDGELIGDKFKPMKKEFKRRSSRSFRTKHKYAQRKDW